MAVTRKKSPPAAAAPVLSNAEIADRLKSLAQLLSTQRENPYKIKAYRRAAETVAGMGESVAELVRAEVDLTAFPAIGKGIAGAIREIVTSGSLKKLDTLRAEVSPELAALTEHPRLDPKRVLQAYKKLRISSVAELKERLESGELGRQLGARMEQHVRFALTEANEILLYDADTLVPAVEKYLLTQCRVRRVEVAGDYRRKVEVIGELSYLIETDDFEAVVRKLQRYGGRTELVSADDNSATFKLSAGIVLRVELGAAASWGVAMVLATGSEEHVAKLNGRGGKLIKLTKSRQPLPDENSAYAALGLPFIPPELRMGRDEVTRAAAGTLPQLVDLADLQGELHAHTRSSDGAHSIEQMAAGAEKRGYTYLGITDHSQSLKIARGVSEEDLWAQIKAIDKLNEKSRGVRVLKSAEVDILADGTLDYPDELLRELDYTMCSIHSRFGLGRQEQTERILRAMDNPYFNILGHATGRLLLRRTGYEIDIDRIVAHAKANGCHFEINSSPDRLDLRVEHARLARDAGVKIALCTDAHSIREFDYIRCGVEQARRAGLEKKHVLNCLPSDELLRVVRRH